MKQRPSQLRFESWMLGIENRRVGVKKAFEVSMR